MNIININNKSKNYNKLPLAFLSDVFYWQSIKHPIAETLKNFIHIFNDYYVENFHSSINIKQIVSILPSRLFIRQK